MAYLQASSIVTRIREVLEDSRGTLRTVPSGRFDGDLPDGLDSNEELRRAIEKPRIVATITSISRSAASPPINGSIILYDLSVDVKVIRTITTLEQISESDLDTLVSLAAEDSDVIRQALEYPTNLSTTQALADTDIVSGLLKFVRSRVTVGKQINDGAQSLTTIHSFTCVAISRPATS